MPKCNKDSNALKFKGHDKYHQTQVLEPSKKLWLRKIISSNSSTMENNNDVT
uniref:Uncharacterized protein n=1 Tax=Rhizophora mucronata TaxID=61149 RepID=A0A2P2M2L3_RHIMU